MAFEVQWVWTIVVLLVLWFLYYIPLPKLNIELYYIILYIKLFIYILNIEFIEHFKVLHFYSPLFWKSKLEVALFQPHRNIDWLFLMALQAKRYHPNLIIPLHSIQHPWLYLIILLLKTMVCLKKDNLLLVICKKMFHKISSSFKLYIVQLETGY